MGLNVSEQSNFKVEPPPSGPHFARCWLIADCGTQYNRQHNKEQAKLRIGWELPNEMREFGTEGEKREEPVIITREFTAMLGDKANLTGFLETWRGRPFTDVEKKGFSMKNLLGATCILTINHETKGDKTYAKVMSATRLMKGMECPEPIFTPTYMSLDEEEFDPDAWLRVPKWIRTGSGGLSGIVASPEYKVLEAKGLIPKEDGEPGAAENDDEGLVIGADDDEAPF